MHHAAFLALACGITHCSPHETIAALSVISLGVVCRATTGLEPAAAGSRRD
jgi:hypothetical protein